jgi:hypothetical protein
MNKDEFWAHLKSEGLMKDFKARRVALEAEGTPKKESWTQAANEFGFGGVAGDSDSKNSSADPRKAPPKPKKPTKEQFEGKSASLRAEFQWVYENAALEDVKPGDAPSSGAWGLLEFARSDPRTFYAKWLEMASKSEDKDLIMEGFREDARRSTSEIAEMLESIQSAVLRNGSEGLEREPEVPSGSPDEIGF